MKISKSPRSIAFVLVIISFLAAGCETFEVGIEPLTTLEPALETQPVLDEPLPSATPPPTAEIVPTETTVVGESRLGHCKLSDGNTHSEILQRLNEKNNSKPNK